MAELVLALAASMLACADSPPRLDEVKSAQVGVGAALDKAAANLMAGRADEALRSLGVVERTEPDNPWLWLYRGIAHRQLHEPYRSLECLDRAGEILISLGDPDPQLADRVRRIRRDVRREVFGFSLQTGLAYDSNVSFLAGGAGQLGLIAGKGDGKFTSQFRLDFAPVADREQTLAAGIRLGHSWHFAIEQFDYQDYGLYFRYVRRMADRWEFSIQYDYDITLLGNERFLSNHAVTSGVSYQWRPTEGLIRPVRTALHYRFEARDFLFDVAPSFDRDGMAHFVGIEQTIDVQPIAGFDWTWGLTAGYRFGSVLTEGREFDRTVNQFYLGAAVPVVYPGDPSRYLIFPDRELVFRFSAEWELARYRNGSLNDRDRDKRSDRITTLGITLSQTLIDDAELGDLVLRAVLNWTDAQSNVATRDRISPFSYDKVVYGLQLVWSF